MVIGKSSSSLVLQDPSFDISKTGQYSVVINVSDALMQFAFFDSERNTIAAIGQKKLEGMTPKSLKDEFENLSFFSGEFNTGALAIQPSNYILLPEIFDGEAEQKSLLSRHCGVEIEEIRADHLPELKLRVVYPMPLSVYEVLMEKFPFAQLRSMQSVNLSAILSKRKFSSGNMMFLELWENRVDIYAWDADQLLLCNSFSKKGQNDVLYHTLNVSQELGMDVSKTEFLFSGDLVHGDALHKLLKKYLPNFKLHYGWQHVNLAPGLKEVRKQNFSGLLTLLSCE